MATLILGEMAALAGAAGAKGQGFARVAVIALGAGSFQIISPFLFGYMTKALADANRRPIRRPILTAFTTPAVVLLALIVGFSPLAAAIWVAWGVL